MSLLRPRKVALQILDLSSCRLNTLSTAAGIMRGARAAILGDDGARIPRLVPLCVVLLKILHYVFDI